MFWFFSVAAGLAMWVTHGAATVALVSVGAEPVRGLAKRVIQSHRVLADLDIAGTWRVGGGSTTSGAKTWSFDFAALVGPCVVDMGLHAVRLLAAGAGQQIALVGNLGRAPAPGGSIGNRWEPLGAVGNR